MTETAWQARKRREDERAAYIAEHGNVCELCGNPPKSRGLSEDHDHRTGEHRGWLCFRCNRALPSYVDAVWCLKAALYLCRFSFGEFQRLVDAVLEHRRFERDARV